jgi:threonyl-tRNA synthetase
MNDHRKLGRELELFASDPLVGAGLPIWLPAGAAARHAVEEYIREEERRAGYQHVYSPPLARAEMYQRSGHLEHFADDMFGLIRDGGPRGAVSEPSDSVGWEGEDALALRPSLCPHHAMVYRSRGRSYRELPLRVAELGGMYRAERSGVLGGLARVRAISLNDAHIFCAPEQAAGEVAGVLRLIERAQAALGFTADGVRLAGRGASAAASAADWDRAEAQLREALDVAGVAYKDAPGEGAFYGPKIDIQIRDPADREWTLATIQLDYVLPERFDLSYVDSDGARRRPVIVHRSAIGSLERLFGHLIEVHDGAFPVWYAPVQVLVLPVGEDQGDAAARFARDCVEAGLRAELAAEGSLGLRVRDAARRRIPYVAVIGAREAAAGAVSLRRRDGHAMDPLPAADALAVIEAAAARP